MTDFETLGAFYLGKHYDITSRTRQDDLLMYDSKDLTTHAVIIGMTGSGKTGLGVGLIEEALIDRIPVIAVDPKGDLGNLALRFPALSASDFGPWIDPQQAANSGSSPEEFAAQQAAAWKSGIESWGQSAERIQRLVDAADVSIFTPGSNAGRPISLLKAFDAPPAAVLADAELLQERISATTISLLSLLGINADPVSSREHILIANILNQSWQAGQSLDLAGLIAAIQTPSFNTVGVMPLDTVFPPKDRTAFAMQLNNLLAAPGFQSWLQGEPLSTSSLLHTPAGKPRCSVISIAHLSDAERMFFVTLLLADILAWVRTQPGTSSLRAILYIDELFGYMPPVANPPSKQLLLTLLKQARAFGLGVVLSTQNPVDLDYRGLSNTGTWFIGRLQTERDKMRVMEGLEGAASAQKFDRAATEQAIAGLGKRVFLMHNVHEKEPITFETRWTLSYLAGPMTREQIRTATGALSNTRTDATAAGAAANASSAAPIPATAVVDHAAALTGATVVATPASSVAPSTKAPILPHDIRQFWMPLSRPNSGNSQLEYQPAVLGLSDVAFNNSKYGVSIQRRVLLLASVDDGPIPLDWDNAQRIDIDPANLQTSALPGASYLEPPGAATSSRNYAAWSKALQKWIGNNEQVMLFKSPSRKAISMVDESERDFRIRLQQLAREERDQKLDALRRKYDTRLATLQEKIRRAEQTLGREQEQASKARLDAAISFGSMVLGALFSKGRVGAGSIGRLGTTARGATRASQQSGDVTRANESLEVLQQQRATLEAELQRDQESMEASFDASSEALEPVPVTPKTSDVQVQFVALVWLPSVVESNGIRSAAWR